MESIALHIELQQKCRTIYQRALIRGMLLRPKQCSQCLMVPRRTLEGHHPDYSKPLEVIWLCHKCHRTLHRGKLA